jgi:DNA damage-inducible protein 1
MLLTCHVHRSGGTVDVVSITVEDPTATDLETLMVLLEVEGGVPALRQQLFLADGSPLTGPERSLASLGVICDQVLHVRIRGAAATPPPRHSASTDPNELIRSLFTAPPAAPAVADPNALITSLFASGAQQQRATLQDLDDPEYQRRVYEEIQRANLEQNLVQALEHTPEAFARVVMLYVPCEVNKVPVTAFVDSGAQMSIMNEATAERCGIMRLLDRRMQGTAVGVGTSKIIGRIHMTIVNLGGLHIPFSISVLEGQKMEFLIGLDQLKRHQMIIDLEKNCLRVQGTEIRFLGEGELPAHLRDEAAEEANPPPPAAASVPPAAIPVSQPLTPAQEAAVGALVELSQKPRDVVLRALQATDWDAENATAMLLD